MARNSYQRRSYRESTQHKLRQKAYDRLNRLVRKIKTSALTGLPLADEKTFVGCNLPELKKHLESTFQEGMTWRNYGRGGGWVKDHIVPLSRYDLREKDSLRRCFHFLNLRACWERDNLKKGRSSLCNYFFAGQLVFLAFLIQLAVFPLIVSERPSFGPIPRCASDTLSRRSLAPALPVGCA